MKLHRGQVLDSHSSEIDQSIEILVTCLRRLPRTKEVTVSSNVVSFISSFQLWDGTVPSYFVTHGKIKFIKKKRGILVSYEFNLKRFWIILCLIYSFCLSALAQFIGQVNSQEMPLFLLFFLFALILFSFGMYTMLSSLIRTFFQEIYKNPSVRDKLRF